MFHVNRYRMLEVRRAMKRERIFRDRTNPLEIYDDLELIERFRYNETSVFALAHAYIVPFFLYFFNVSFYGIPGIYYVCNFLLCPIFVPRSYRRGKLCLQNNFSLLVLFQQYNFFSICPIWLPFRQFLFSSHE